MPLFAARLVAWLHWATASAGCRWLGSGAGSSIVAWRFWHGGHPRAWAPEPGPRRAEDRCGVPVPPVLLRHRGQPARRDEPGIPPIATAAGDPVGRGAGAVTPPTVWFCGQHTIPGLRAQAAIGPLPACAALALHPATFAWIETQLAPAAPALSLSITCQLFAVLLSGGLFLNEAGPCGCWAARWSSWAERSCHRDLSPGCGPGPNGSGERSALGDGAQGLV